MSSLVTLLVLLGFAGDIDITKDLKVLEVVSCPDGAEDHDVAAGMLDVYVHSQVPTQITLTTDPSLPRPAAEAFSHAFFPHAQDPSCAAGLAEDDGEQPVVGTWAWVPVHAGSPVVAWVQVDGVERQVLTTADGYIVGEEAFTDLDDAATALLAQLSIPPPQLAAVAESARRRLPDDARTERLVALLAAAAELAG